MANLSEKEIQRRYYAETAYQYNALHVHTDDTHYFALSILVGIIDFLGIRSILDIGSGTGRAVQFIKKMCPNVKVVGLEPVAELREVGYSQGLSPEELIAGDAIHMAFANGEFDMVCEFGVLHHIKKPERAVAEMLRVAKRAIFISDSNNFGQGPVLIRTLKQIINFFGLWKLADLVKTKGKGYTISEGDGLAYSYSVYTNYAQIAQQCERIHVLNTGKGGINPYRTADNVALLGVKRSQV